MSIANAFSSTKRTDTKSSYQAQIAAIDAQTVASTASDDLVRSKLERLLSGGSFAEVDIDLNGDFEAALKKDKATQENLAKLIHSLTEASRGLTDQFKSISGDTFLEKVVALVSKERAEVMKVERIRNASIADNLNELLRSSDKLLVALKELLISLEMKYESTLTGQKRVNEKYEAGEVMRVQLTAELERLSAEREAMQSSINALTSEVSRAERASLETDFAEISNQFNTASERLQTCMSTQQKLADHRSSYGNYTYSLAKIIATQKTLIAGLEIDTEESTTLFETLTEAIKASKQQEYAAQINLAGRVAHSMANELMLQIGQSARNSVINTMNMDKVFAERAEKYKVMRDQAEKTFTADMAKIQQEFELRTQAKL